MIIILIIATISISFIIGLITGMQSMKEKFIKMLKYESTMELNQAEAQQIKNLLKKLNL